MTNHERDQFDQVFKYEQAAILENNRRIIALEEENKALRKRVDRLELIAKKERGK